MTRFSTPPSVITSILICRRPPGRPDRRHKGRRWHIPLRTTKSDTILIVDDDWEASESWAKGLLSCSPQYTVLTTDNVKSALDVCRCQKMACVVLDLVMNDESGFEILVDLVPDRLHREVAIVRADPPHQYHRSPNCAEVWCLRRFSKRQNVARATE